MKPFEGGHMERFARLIYDRVERVFDHWVWYVIGVFTLVLEAILAIWIFLYQPPLLSTIEASSEIVSISVGDGARATFPVFGMRIWLRDDPKDLGCINGYITPADGSRVTYSRIAEGEILVTIAWEQIDGAPSPSLPVAQFGHENDDPIPLKTGLLELRPDTALCGKASPTTWPIWGDASLGREFKPASGGGDRMPSFILHGELKAEARSLWSNTTYPVPPVTLPVGGRLETAQERADDPPTQWWGIAYIDPQKPALTVAAGTEARILHIYRPLKTDPDIVELSFLSRFFDDPAIRPLHAIAGGLGLSWFFRRRDVRPRFQPNENRGV